MNTKTTTKTKTTTTKTEKETKQLAKKLAKTLQTNKVIYLKGDLGTGKTTFTKGFAEALGIKEKQIKSPTYTLLRQYKLKNKTLFHFDLYRIEEADDYIIHEIETAKSTKNAYILIEWPEKLKNYDIKEKITITFKYISNTERQITIEQ